MDMKVRAYAGAVNTYANSPLAGCINDARGMLDLFGEVGGWDVDMARIQYNDAMTNDDVKDAWEWWTDGEEQYRLVVESGHGSHRPRVPTAETPDPTEEFLCPIDIDLKWGAPDLVSDYFIEKKLLKFRRFPKRHKAFIFGFHCESGGKTQTAVDDAAEALVRVPNAKVKYLRSPWEMQNAQERQKAVATPRVFQKAEDNVFEDDDAREVYFGACRSNQFSYEVSEVLTLNGPNDSRKPVAFDVSRKLLCDVIRENRSITVRKAHKEVVERIKVIYNFDQTPQLWGPKYLLDSDFFS